MTSIACIVVAGPTRQELLDLLVMPSVLRQQFDEVVVVGNYHSGDGYRHLPFAPICHSTVDALFARDTATMATTSDWLVYLADDHALDQNFVARLRDAVHASHLGRRHIGVPARYTMRAEEGIRLNTGFPDYVAGHCAVLHRTAVQEVPWGIAPRHPNWDVFHSQVLMARGYALQELPDCLVEDVEPNATPWL